MNRERRNSLILAAVGLLALASGLVGYSGWGSRITAGKHAGVVAEAQRVVDAAQLWYARPALYDGGDRSFVGLDFRKLGLGAGGQVGNDNDNDNDKEGGMENRERTGRIWQQDGYQFELVNITDQTFDLLVRARDGSVWEARDIGFDTRVKLRRMGSK